MSRHRFDAEETMSLTSGRKSSFHEAMNGDGGGGGGAHPLGQHTAKRLDSFVRRIDSLLSTGIAVVLLLLLCASWIEPPNYRATRKISTRYDACHLDVHGLVQRFDLSSRFHYSRNFVVPSTRDRELDPTLAFGRFDPHPRQISAQLAQEFDELDSNSLATAQLSTCSVSNIVDVPFFPPHHSTRTQGKNIMVGYATNTARIRKWTPMLQHSFAHTGLHLVLQLPGNEDGVDLARDLNALGIRTSIIHDDAEYRIRWARLPMVLYPLADRNTQWIMVSDDDSFVLSLPRILAVLDKYDPRQHHFVGTLSDKWANMVFGPESFGGGGTFLSLPLVKHLLPHWEAYAQREWLIGGDQRMSWCVFENSYARLSWEPTVLTQNDAEGDIQGLIESGQRFGTFHHLSWRERQHNESLFAFAAQACGPSRSECLFQRFLLPEHRASPSSSSTRFMLTHGWSLVRYPTAHLPDFGRTELTWDHAPQDYWSHGMGPLRDKVEERTRETKPDGPWKESWLLAEVKLAEGSEPARHTYVKRGGVDGLDSVIELVWL